MRKAFLMICVYLSLGFHSELKAQVQAEGILLKGFVIGADTNNAIPLANILKKPSGERYISNRYGAFGIQVQENDTLVFSVIGYQNLFLPVKKYVLEKHTDPIRIKLKPTTYRLKEAEINYHQKKRDSLAQLAAKTLKTSPILNDYSHVDSWISGSSGSMVTDLFASSNKKLQEYYKVQRLIELYHEQELVDEKYNDELIMRATGIKKEKIQEFKKYCNLPHYFILNSIDYDLVLAIRACYTEYDRQNR